MISVIVPHQVDKSKPYLDLCLKALNRSQEVAFEVWIVDGSETCIEYGSKYTGFKHVYSREHVGVAAKLSLVMPMISRSTTHIALISDDVMVSQYMLSDMVRAFQNREMIMNPMSNSDCFSLYEAEMYLKDTSNNIKRIYPDIEIEEMEGWANAVSEYPRGNKCLVPFQTLSFYCTMIPMAVWNKLGNLDPELEFRHNDQDYCMRASRVGIPSVVNFGAFAFHFGSKTMRHMANDELKMKCTEHFRKKWMSAQSS